MIIFFAASFLGFYHSIGHEKTLLNDSLLQDEEQVGNILKTQKSLAMFRRNRKENSETVSSFSFTEIAKFKFFCCFDRKQEKYLRYKELLGNVSRKLDFARVMANQANVGLLSHVFLEPY